MTKVPGRANVCRRAPRLGVSPTTPRSCAAPVHAIAHILGDKAAKAANGVGNAAMVGADDLAQILGIEAGRQRRRTNEITEHHRQLAPLGLRGRRYIRDCRRHCRGGRRGVERGDGGQKLAAMTDRGHANADQVLSCQLRQNRGIDVVVTKSGLVLPQIQAAQPRGNVHQAPFPLSVWPEMALVMSMRNTSLPRRRFAGST
jgi:hypothetical protein